jgi:predicted P-loop ATPase
VAVLEGPQGVGKSSALVILAGRGNFSDQEILTLDDRAQAEALEGVLIYEISELTGLKRTEIERVKAFISRTEDRARPAYGRFREDRPRTAIFVGTTNDDTYLRDATGNRRFLPVPVGKIDLVGLTRDRDQLWAEAAYREAQGEAIELPATLYATAAELQDSRLEPEPWLDTLTYFTCVAEDDGQKVSSEHLLTDVLKIPIDKQTTAIAKRLASAMRQLGWEGPKPIRIRGRVTRGYILPYAQKKLPL